MEPPISPLLFAVLLFFGMLILLEAGRRLGIWRRLSGRLLSNPRASDREEKAV
jgi:hypothetical protein